MGGFDPGLDKLQALCAALEATNDVLEIATPDLDARGKDLHKAEDDLREALDGLRTEADGLEKDVTGSEAQATEAASDLGTAAHQVLETWLSGFDEKVAAAKADSHQSLTQRADTLQSEFDELQTRGFEALDAVLTQEDSEFERWTNEADTALNAQVEALETAAEEAVHANQRIFSAFTTANNTAAAASGEMRNKLTDQMEAFDKDEPAEVEHRCGDARTDVVERIAQWEKALEAEIAAAHQAVQGFATTAGHAIEEEGTQATDAVELVGTALAEAEMEFAQAGADATVAEPEMGAVAELRPKVENADEEVTEIKQLTEALGQ